MHSLLVYIISKIKLILYIEISIIIIFALIYYNIQFIIKNAFVRTTIEGKENNLSNIENYSFLECIHFSLVTQTTLGYGDMIPKGKLSTIINSIQILTIYLIPIITFI